MDMKTLVTVGIFLFGQTIYVVSWGTSLGSEVQQLKRDMEKQERVVNDIPDMKASLKNIERLLERMQGAASAPRPFRE